MPVGRGGPADGPDAAGSDAPPPLDHPADATLAGAVLSGTSAGLSAEELAQRTGISRVLLDAVEREGLLVPRVVDGERRYGDADVEVVRAGLALLEAGIPLGELLALARRVDAALRGVAEHAVEVFVRYVRDPVQVGSPTPEEAGARLVAAFERMLPAAGDVVGHHFRRLIVAAAEARIAAEADADVGARADER